MTRLALTGKGIALKQYRGGLLTYEEALRQWLKDGGTVRGFEEATGIPWERPAK